MWIVRNKNGLIVAAFRDRGDAHKWAGENGYTRIELRNVDIDGTDYF